MCSPNMSWLSSADGNKQFVVDGQLSHTHLREEIQHVEVPIPTSRVATICDDPLLGVRSFEKVDIDTAYPLDVEFFWFERESVLLIERFLKQQSLVKGLDTSYIWKARTVTDRMITATFYDDAILHWPEGKEIAPPGEEILEAGRFNISEIRNIIRERFASFDRCFDWCRKQWEKGDEEVPKALWRLLTTMPHAMSQMHYSKNTQCSDFFLNPDDKQSGEDALNFFDMHKKTMTRFYRSPEHLKVKVM